MLSYIICLSISFFPILLFSTSVENLVILYREKKIKGIYIYVYVLCRKPQDSNRGTIRSRECPLPVGTGREATAI
jgi:hypothetical protein